VQHPRRDNSACSDFERARHSIHLCGNVKKKYSYTLRTSQTLRAPHSFFTVPRMSGAAGATIQGGGLTMNATYPDPTIDSDRGLDDLVNDDTKGPPEIKLIVSIGNKKKTKEYTLIRQHVKFQSVLVSTTLDQDPDAGEVLIKFLKNHDDEKLCEKIADAMTSYIRQMQDKKSKRIPIPLTSARLPSNADITFIDKTFETMRELKTFFSFANYMEVKPLVANVGAKIAAELLPYKAAQDVINDPRKNVILRCLDDTYPFKKESQKTPGQPFGGMTIRGPAVGSFELSAARPRDTTQRTTFRNRSLS